MTMRPNASYCAYDGADGADGAEEGCSVVSRKGSLDMRMSRPCVCLPLLLVCALPMLSAARPASAADWQVVGSRQRGMGGAGVATAMRATPATMAGTTPMISDEG